MYELPAQMEGRKRRTTELFFFPLIFSPFSSSPIHHASGLVFNESAERVVVVVYVAARQPERHVGKMGISACVERCKTNVDNAECYIGGCTFLSEVDACQLSDLGSSRQLACIPKV